MKSQARLFSAQLLALSLSCWIFADARLQVGPSAPSDFNELARFLAGRPTGSASWAALEQTEAWIEHARLCEQVWQRLERTQLKHIRAWGDVELKEATAQRRAVFYPFGGPDFLYAQAFFPNASDYVLVGLEPAGSLPDWRNFTEQDWSEYLGDLLASLQEILSFTFFRTDDMKQHIEAREGSGILPILLFFLGRTGNYVVGIDRVSIQPNGDVVSVEDFRKPPPPGARLIARRIRFQAATGGPRNLYYFPFDLSNYSLRRRPGFIAFLKKRQPFNSFVKAASYLMYRSAFSDVRSLLTDQSEGLLQDDSGVPVEYFDTSKWRLRFYGRYEKPIQLFEERYQPALEEYYRQGEGIPKLPFGFGYRRRADQSNLMLAQRIWKR